jgi:hypothetical protein
MPLGIGQSKIRKAKKTVGRTTRRVSTATRKVAPKVAAGAAFVEKVAPAIGGSRGKAIGKAAGAVKTGAVRAGVAAKTEQAIRKARRTQTRKR